VALSIVSANSQMAALAPACESDNMIADQRQESRA
jgi:hypothetical protein